MTRAEQRGQEQKQGAEQIPPAERGSQGEGDVRLSLYGVRRGR